MAPKWDLEFSKWAPMDSRACNPSHLLEQALKTRFKRFRSWKAQIWCFEKVPISELKMQIWNFQNGSQSKQELAITLRGSSWVQKRDFNRSEAEMQESRFLGSSENALRKWRQNEIWNFQNGSVMDSRACKPSHLLKQALKTRFKRFRSWKAQIWCLEKVPISELKMQIWNFQNGSQSKQELAITLRGSS